MGSIKKDYLTFSELCNRWKIIDQDMHYLISKGDLVPSIAWGLYLIKCYLIGAEDGEAEFTGANRRNYAEKAGWLYLQLPKLAGDCAYRFTYAHQNLRPPTDDFLSQEPWYMLCGEYDCDDRPIIEHVDEAYVASECVFMADSVADCEARHPELAEGSIALSIAIATESSVEKVASIVDMASKGGKARHANSPKQIAKAKVKADWDMWQTDLSLYASKAAFARDSLHAYPVLTSEKVITDWCREWEEKV